MIKVSIVNYLNSKPFLKGLKEFKFSQPIQLIEDIPSQVSNQLLNGETDIALVPIATLIEDETLRFIKPYGIGAHGKVKSVLINSTVPIEDIKSLRLDFHSKTSNMLALVLLSEMFNQKVSTSFEDENADAFVAIGDKTFTQIPYPFVYDLSELWKQLTGLPFVFAVWAYKYSLGSSFEIEFNKALKYGLNEREAIAEQLQANYPIDVLKYFTKFINYEFDDSYYQSITLFLQKIKQFKLHNNHETEYK